MTATETLTRAGDVQFLARMSNVLDDEKQQQILALGRLGWTVSRIAEAATVRRETATRYLRAANAINDLRESGLVRV